MISYKVTLVRTWPFLEMTAHTPKDSIGMQPTLTGLTTFRNPPSLLSPQAVKCPGLPGWHSWWPLCLWSINPQMSQTSITCCPWQAHTGSSNSWQPLKGPQTRDTGKCLLWPGPCYYRSLIWNRDLALHYLKHVISLLLSQKKLACFKTMWIFKYDAFLPANWQHDQDASV